MRTVPTVLGETPMTFAKELLEHSLRVVERGASTEIDARYVLAVDPVSEAERAAVYEAENELLHELACASMTDEEIRAAIEALRRNPTGAYRFPGGRQ